MPIQSKWESPAWVYIAWPFVLSVLSVAVNKSAPPEALAVLAFVFPQKMLLPTTVSAPSSLSMAKPFVLPEPLFMTVQLRMWGWTRKELTMALCPNWLWFQRNASLIRIGSVPHIKAAPPAFMVALLPSKR